MCATPLKVTVDEVRNPVPLIAIDPGLEPVGADDGDRFAMDGVGFWVGVETDDEFPPPHATTNTESASAPRTRSEIIEIRFQLCFIRCILTLANPLSLASATVARR